MKEEIPKISVVIISYKQEELIKRAIDSLLIQKDYIYEICVSDDCSPDNTWQVLLDYQNQYPGLFKLHRNEPNIGIFENVELSWTMPSGDIVYFMAGDDEAGFGWFKKVVEFIQDNRIDYRNEDICIYGDYKNIYPNGDSIIHRNKIILTGVSPLRLSLRGLVGNRSCCISISIVKQYRKVSQGRSHIAEDAQDRQLQIFSKKNYYIPYIGNIYYSYIGVSSHLTEETMMQRAKIRPYAFELFEKWGIVFNEKDKIYSLNCFPAYERMLNKPTIGNIWNWIYYLVKSNDSSIPYFLWKWRNFFFAIIRRIPHSKPIIFK